MSDNGESLGADFVDGVLWGVPVTGGILEINHVNRWNVAAEKRQVVVFHGCLLAGEHFLVTEADSGFPHQICKPLGGVRLSLGAKVTAADDIGKKKGFNFGE